jgi:hypothetical protein
LASTWPVPIGERSLSCCRLLCARKQRDHSGSPHLAPTTPLLLISQCQTLAPSLPPPSRRRSSPLPFHFLSVKNKNERPVTRPHLPRHGTAVPRRPPPF